MNGYDKTRCERVLRTLWLLSIENEYYIEPIYEIKVLRNSAVHTGCFTALNSALDHAEKLIQEA